MIDDPVPRDARTELERLGRRWQTMPLDQALACAGVLRGLAQQYAEECARRQGLSGPVPLLGDLGPAAAMDQLTVLTYDVARLRPAPERAGLAADLAQVRRGLPQ